MGLTIEKIHLGNSNSHWTFHTPNGMQFTRTPNEYVNKEFDIVKLRVYVNTLSEMLVPTSLWLATKDSELQIFSAISASEIKSLMCSAFDEKKGSMHYFNLLEPMFVNVAMNFNNSYNPAYKNEPFKYQIAVLNSKVILSVTPAIVKDIFQLQAYLEMQSYIKELRRYRPSIKIITMIAACAK